MNVRGKRILSVSTSVQTRKEVTVVLVSMVTDCVTTPTLVRVGEINHEGIRNNFCRNLQRGLLSRNVLVEILEVALFLYFLDT
jgi:hypothetical protein